MENKKIKNAKSSTYQGIKFRSKSEERMYKKLLSLGFSPLYEPDTFTLFHGFRPEKIYFYEGIPQIIKSGESKVLEDWKYTPDFRLDFGEDKMYIEVKGFPNDLWTYKRKLFLKLLESYERCYFFVVKTIRGLMKSLEAMKSIHNGNTNINQDSKSDKISS